MGRFLSLLLGPRLRYLMRFYMHHNRLLRVFSPVRMTDKLALRILSQQCTPLRRELTDKLTCREIVRAMCPELRVKSVYGIYESPEQFSLAALPQAFVLKPNGASGLNLVVLDKSAARETELRKIIAEWLRVSYFKCTQEPSYRGIENKVFAEELLLSAEGFYPMEFRIFCFHRKACCIEYEVAPNTPGLSALFDRDWNPLPAYYLHGRSDLDPGLARAPRPLHLETAIQVAERLAEGLDFIRVDLYDLPDGLAFGEMTSHPWAGLVSLSPPGADELLGRYWEPFSASPVDRANIWPRIEERKELKVGVGS